MRGYRVLATLIGFITACGGTPCTTSPGAGPPDPPDDEHCEPPAHVRAIGDWSSADLSTIRSGVTVWTQLGYSIVADEDQPWNADQRYFYLVRTPGLTQWSGYLGQAFTDLGVAVIDSDVHGTRLYSVAAHEVGHLLGISHIATNQYGIMHPTATATKLTDEDRKAACAANEHCEWINPVTGP